MAYLSIGQLARRSCVKVTTIRYYETIGLLEEPERTESGQRIFTDSDVQRLSFIRHTRDLGFPVEDVRALISLQADAEKDCASVDRIARHQLGAVRRRLTKLEALEAELKRMIAACEGGTVASCSVLAALGDHDDCLVGEHEGAELMAVPPSKRS